MSHEATIVNEEKKENAVRIEYEVKIDGSVIDYPDLDGDVIEHHFDVDYKKYRDNEKVDKALKTWAEQMVEKRIEQHNSSESAEGRKVKI